METDLKTNSQSSLLSFLQILSVSFRAHPAKLFFGQALFGLSLPVALVSYLIPSSFYLRLSPLSPFSLSLLFDGGCQDNLYKVSVRHAALLLPVSRGKVFHALCAAIPFRVNTQGRFPSRTPLRPLSTLTPRKLMTNFSFLPSPEKYIFFPFHVHPYILLCLRHFQMLFSLALCNCSIFMKPVRHIEDPRRLPGFSISTSAKFKMPSKLSVRTILWSSVALGLNERKTANQETVNIGVYNNSRGVSSKR